MDGVLCHLDDEKRLGFLARLSSLGHDEIRQAIWGSGFELRSDAGEFDAETYLREFGERVGYPITHGEWCDYRKGAMTPDYEVLKIVSELAEKGTVAMLTNNGHQLKRALAEVFPELPPLFGRHLYFSGDFYQPKPHPQIYLDVCSRMLVEPGETFFVDDRVENVLGAENAGLVGHLFTSAGGLREALSAFYPPFGIG